MPRTAGSWPRRDGLAAVVEAEIAEQIVPGVRRVLADGLLRAAGFDVGGEQDGFVGFIALPGCCALEGALELGLAG